MSEEQLSRKYSNSMITVHWQPRLCCHSGECLRSLPKVFRAGRRPWINIEGGTTEQIIKAVEMCPSGALSYNYNTK